MIGATRVVGLLLLVAGALVLPRHVSAEDATSGTGARRNVLLMISDDQGLDAGCYGNADVHTPGMDRLASQGLRFTHAFAAVSSCSPSRSTLFTGLYNHTSGQYGLAHAAHNQRTRGEVRSLPLILSGKGYRTGIIGKCHVEPKEVYPFDVHTGERANRNPAALARLTREFIEGAGSAPFFLVVGFGDTHRPFARSSGRTETTTPRAASALKLPNFLTDLPQVRDDYAAYLDSVDNLDRCVGAVTGVLDDRGLTSSTLVIFVSDNGIPFPGAKTNFYDAGIHLPMIVRAPTLPAPGATTDAMASWVDVAPTILDWTGVPGADEMHGRSLLPVLRDPHAAGWDLVFASHTFHEITMYYPMRCVRTRDYKLIWNLAHQLPYPLAGDIRNSPSWKAIRALPDGRVGKRTMDQYLNRHEFELYDLRTDAGELRNLAQDPDHGETLKCLKGELLDMMRRTKDPWLNAVGDEAKKGE